MVWNWEFISSFCHEVTLGDSGTIMHSFSLLTHLPQRTVARINRVGGDN